MEILKNIIIVMNLSISMYTIYYLITGIFVFLKNKKIPEFVDNKKFAIVIPARNEEMVIGNLLESLEKQNYPKDKFTIFVVPNNCRDNTKKVAMEKKANIIDCNIPVKSKGEVLQFVFKHISREYDGYIIFDADNVVHPDFLNKMNDALSAGYNVAQGYRDSKNPNDTWVSNCYAIYQYMQNSFLNQARMNVGMSAFINGTGFMISKKIINNMVNLRTMTEDTELSIQCALLGEKIAFVNNAITYDEQPLTFEESWKQRKRWSAGTLECLKIYGKNLLKHKTKTSLDSLMLLMLPIIQVLGSLLCSVYAGIEVIINSQLYYILPVILGFFVSNIVAIFSLIVQGKSIKKNIKGVITFPVFIFSWVIVSAIALVKQDRNWETIKHTRVIKAEEIIC